MGTATSMIKGDLERKQRVKQLRYVNWRRTYNDLSQAAKSFPELQLGTGTCCDLQCCPLGISRLMYMRGYLQIINNGKLYGIPIVLWITIDYPVSAPLVYVEPTPFMTIPPNRPDIDEKGRIGVPFFFEWNAINSNSTIVNLLKTLGFQFGTNPPVVSKATGHTILKSTTLSNLTDPELRVKRAKEMLSHCKYVNQEAVLNDLLPVFRCQRSFSETCKAYAFEDGEMRPLLCVKGSLFFFENGTQNELELSLWLPLEYPLVPPVVYLNSSLDSAKIKSGDYVTKDGSFVVPYLYNWDRQTCNLNGLLENIKYLLDDSHDQDGSVAATIEPFGSSEQASSAEELKENAD